MRRIVTVILVIALPFAGHAQGRHVSHFPDTVTVYKDVFSGILGVGDSKAAATLELRHKRYYDYGTFILDEKASDGNRRYSGDWTVLRGDATDDNATVVELDAAHDIFYFLRRKDGRLQQLDTTLHALKPASGYFLSQKPLHKN